ncbi:cytochrome c-type biogenesis protein CcmF [Sporomusaceae bacterium FL31]|nr:cytochrome c-type biogenesis protein CcmF [Sporomusaceae bacterium FL31]GCE34650.1 cytochrome c-type biogenesis protein CcmF [Sporomusaceae bacterium]
MIGYAGITLALVASILAVGFYGAAVQRTKTEGIKIQQTAQWVYRLSTGLIGIAASYLLYLLLNDQFEYAYVAGYSARELAAAYKISAFWAGQEGSFMLWLVFHAVFGLLLSSKPATPVRTMAAYSLLQAVILVIVLIKSPFMMLTQVPPDGNGLNPLLQDPWMVIHPPVIFLGYAALAVPFSYAIHGMLSGQHEEWLTAALPWALFALSSLGAGIFIGGYWAYKVLGWGGYWAWDPVENSSLVPWLAAGALVHMLILAKVRVSAIRQSYLLGLFSFILVLYGTFLTRSGVLSDFSTHSFADEGVGGLLGFIVLLVAFASFALYIVKYHTMPLGELYLRLDSREFILALTALVLAFFGLLVFAGMSTPLVTKAFGAAKSLGTSFYNNATLPLAMAMAVALAAGPLVKWGKPAGDNWKSSWWLGIFFAGGVVLALWLQLSQPIIIAIVALSAAALAATSYAGFRRWLTPAAVCSHMGVILLMIGIMASGAGSRSETVTFVQGQEQMVFGEKLTFTGAETDRSNLAVYTNFKAGAYSSPIAALTKLNKFGEPAAREPGIYRSLLADIYLAPIAVEEKQGEELTLSKGQTLMLDDVSLKFVKFTMKGMDGSEPVRVEAFVEVSANGQIEEVRPEIASQNGRIIGSTVSAFKRYDIHLIGIKPGEGKIVIEFKDTQAAQAAGTVQLEAEVSHKPLINLVWLGASLITAGAAWAGIKRSAVSKQTLEKGQSPASGTIYKAQGK